MVALVGRNFMSSLLKQAPDFSDIWWLVTVYTDLYKVDPDSMDLCLMKCLHGTCFNFPHTDINDMYM